MHLTQNILYITQINCAQNIYSQFSLKFLSGIYSQCVTQNFLPMIRTQSIFSHNFHSKLFHNFGRTIFSNNFNSNYFMQFSIKIIVYYIPNIFSHGFHAFIQNILSVFCTQIIFYLNMFFFNFHSKYFPLIFNQNRFS